MKPFLGLLAAAVLATGPAACAPSSVAKAPPANAHAAPPEPPAPSPREDSADEATTPAPMPDKPPAEPVDEAALAFFNSLSGSLRIELTVPAVRIHPDLMNQRAPAEATINSLRLEVQVWIEAEERMRPITEEELERVVFRQPSIRMIGEGGPEPIEHAAPDGKRFTVRDLVHAVEETERQTRGNSEWFGGVDVHHTFFEGMSYVPEQKAWSIHWGS